MARDYENNKAAHSHGHRANRRRTFAFRDSSGAEKLSGVESKARKIHRTTSTASQNSYQPDSVKSASIRDWSTCSSASASPGAASVFSSGSNASSYYTPASSIAPLESFKDSAEQLSYALAAAHLGPGQETPYDPEVSVSRYHDDEIYEDISLTPPQPPTTHTALVTASHTPTLPIASMHSEYPPCHTTIYMPPSGPGSVSPPDQPWDQRIVATAQWASDQAVDRLSGAAQAVWGEATTYGRFVTSHRAEQLKLALAGASLAGTVISASAKPETAQQKQGRTGGLVAAVPSLAASVVSHGHSYHKYKKKMKERNTSPSSVV